VPGGAVMQDSAVLQLSASNVPVPAQFLSQRVLSFYLSCHDLGVYPESREIDGKRCLPSVMTIIDSDTLGVATFVKIYIR
jgi:hypothetical protein